MDYLDGFVVETEKARDTAVTVFNNFAGLLKGMRERLTRAAEEIDQLERRRAALQAKLKAEFEDGDRRLEAQNLRIKEAHRTAEQLDKENDRRRAAGRAMFASIA
jgi:hypothetical protein